MFSCSAGGRCVRKKFLVHFQGSVCPSGTVILYKVSFLSWLTFFRVNDMLKIRSVNMVAMYIELVLPHNTKDNILGKVLNSIFEYSSVIMAAFIAAFVFQCTSQKPWE